MKFVRVENRIHIKRAVMEQESGDNAMELVGVLPRGALRIGPRLRNACTEAEVAEIEQWLMVQSRIQGLQAELAVHSLPDQIGAAAKWLRHADPNEAAGVVEEIRASLPALRRVMKRIENRG